MPGDGADLGLARQITDGFALGPLRRMVAKAQGAMGRVWRLDSESGSFAVKESLRPDDIATFEIQLAFAAAVSEQVHRAGVLVPRARRSRTGSFILPVYSGRAEEPMYVRVATWIDGRMGVDTAAASWLGSTLAVIETLPDPPTPPRDPWFQAWFTTVPTIDQWRDLTERGTRVGADWVSALARHLPEFGDLSALVGVPPADRLTVAHTDLQPKNVLTTASGYALLDWDDVASASRDRVLARAINDWHLRAGVIDADSVHATLASYRAGGGTGTLRDSDAFGDLIAGFLNYLYEQVQVTLDQSGTEPGTAADQARAMTTDPIDMATLRRLSALDEAKAKRRV